MSRIPTNWSQLPPELLEKIAGTLDEIADRVRFGGVCKSWRPASKSTSLPQARLPWLLLEDPEGFRIDEVQSFFSLSDNKIYTLHLQETFKNSYYSSAYGWFLIVDESGRKRIVSLLNPITKARILLPPLIASIVRCKLIATPETLITMVVSDSGRLIYCYRQRKGVDAESEWAKISVMDPKGKFPGTMDFTYYGGHYFVLGKKGGETLIIDPDTCQVISVIPYVGNYNYSNFSRQFLAESFSGEELFLVIAHSRSREERFEVFELDRTDEQLSKWTWSKVRSIGCNMLFVDYQHAMVLSASYVNGCRENCIVFFDCDYDNGDYDYDYDHKKSFYPRWWSDVTSLSLFDIGNDRFEQIPRSWHESIKDWANQGWFVPSI